MKSPIPKYFAGWLNTEDTVSGGTGATIDDALHDYFENYASGECDDAFYGVWGGRMKVQIWTCLSRDDAYALYGEDVMEDHWSFMLDRVVEEHSYLCAAKLNAEHPDGFIIWTFEELDVVPVNGIGDTI